MKIRDKGFLVTLGVCVLAVGAVAAVSLSYAFPSEDETTPPITATTEGGIHTTTTARQVQNPVTDVADLRTTTTAATTVATTTVPTAAELYVLPLTNEVKKPFSNGELVYSATMQDWRVHNGVDFVGKEEAEVKATANGTVAAIREDTLWGTVLELDHGFGIVSRYCGVSVRNLQVGDTVRVGDPIGVLSSVPCEQAEGAHLHFEILVDGKPMDAVEVIGVEMRYSE